jgi:hypothetical protein
VPALVCWDRGSVALRQLTQSVRALHAVSAAHLHLTLRAELARMASQRQLSAPIRAMRQLEELSASGIVDQVVAAAILISDVRRSVSELSDVVGVSPRALTRYCRQRNLPRPVSLLGWARAIHIVAPLYAKVMSLDEIARCSGEISARECSEYLRYHTGAGPTVWVRRGGLDVLLGAFSHRLGAVGDHVRLIRREGAFRAPTMPEERVAESPAVNA